MKVIHATFDVIPSWDDRSNGWILSCTSYAKRKCSENWKKRWCALRNEEQSQLVSQTCSQFLKTLFFRKSSLHQPKSFGVFLFLKGFTSWNENINYLIFFVCAWTWITPNLLIYCNMVNYSIKNSNCFFSSFQYIFLLSFPFMIKWCLYDKKNFKYFFKMVVILQLLMY